MKNKTLFDSIQCALRGLCYAIKTEKNYKYYLIISAVFCIINIYLNVGMLGYFCHIVTTLGVFSSECFNTSMEHLVNMIDGDIKEEIRIIKDVAASGVLCWGIAFIICEFVMIGCCFI